MIEIAERPDIVREAARVYRECVQQLGIQWDEIFYWYSVSTASQESMQHTYRHKREVNFYQTRIDFGAQDRLRQHFQEMFQAIAQKQGRFPKVAVLSVTKDGTAKFICDFNDANHLDITFNHVGQKKSYFTREQIDPPKFALKSIAEGIKWENLLDGKPVFELRFLDSDFGPPGPQQLLEVEFALDEVLTRPELGKIVGSDFQNDDKGRLIAVLRVAVVDPEDGPKRIAEVLKKIRAPRGTTLRQMTPPGAAYPLDLKDKNELVIDAATDLKLQLLAEIVRCSPASWTKATLMIVWDGHDVDYKLSSENAGGSATISTTLMQVCEDFRMISWMSGNKWASAELSFNKAHGTMDYDTKFHYDRAEVAPPPAPEEPAKPWWRFW